MRNDISVPFFKASISQKEIDAVVAVLRSGWLTTGGIAQEFQRQCGAYIENPNSIALSSGTAALSLAYRLSDFEGQKVVVPSYTFGSCVAELLHLSAKPVLVDIDPGTMNLDITQALELAKDTDARGIVAVHFAGQPCDMELLETETQSRGLSLVDDACHAFGAKSNGRKIGSFKSLSAFSFYATKCITTAEGGLLSTYDPEQLKKASVLSLHGISKDAWKRYSEEGNWFYEIVEKGHKANLPDILAAVGLAQLQRADELLMKRKAICMRYDRAFSLIEELITPSHVESESSYHLYPLRISPEKLRTSRNDMIEQLRKVGVHCSVHFIPIHLHPYFRECSDVSWEELSKTETFYENEISLPLYPDMTDDQIEHVISQVFLLVERNMK